MTPGRADSSETLSQARDAEAKTRKPTTAQLKEALAMRDREAEVLEARVQRLMERESTLRELLLDAHEQLFRRDEELAIALSRAAQHGPASTSGPTPALAESMRYHDLVVAIREVVRSMVPAGATVIVVSKGDPELVNLDARTGWHFPQAEDRGYAGFYPADGSAAISHLETLREQGAEYMVFPATALWWLDRYEGLSQHLDQRYRRVFDDQEVGVLFELTAGPTPTPDGFATVLETVQQAVAGLTPPGSTVLVVTHGDARLLEVDGRAGWHFPPDEDGIEILDGAVAVARLERLRQSGAEFLIFPRTAFRWLDDHEQLRAHLESTYALLLRDNSCIAFDLRRRRRIRHLAPALRYLARRS